MTRGVPKSSETDTLAACLTALSLRGAVVVRVHSGALQKASKLKSGETREYWIKLAPEGTSDILGVYRGVALAIEVKRPGARTKPEREQKQKEFLGRWAEAGGRGYWQVEGVADIGKIIDEIDKEKGPVKR
jgi:hypothetical protein